MNAVWLAGLLALSPTSGKLESLPEIAGWMRKAELAEFSGLARSQRRNNRFWAINDGGSAPSLWALDSHARIQGEVQVSGVSNIDWEDLTSFRYQGEPWLLIADSGDNNGLRNDVSMLVVPEPRQTRGAVKLAWQVRFRYPDGQHDSESTAVDAANGYIYLVSKRIRPSVLYRLPLRPAGKGVVTAERIGALGGIPQPTAEQLANRSNFMRYASEPTAMDLSCDGRTLVLLTYARMYFFERADAAADFGPVLAAPVDSLTLPPLPQAEAIAYNRGCTRIYVGSESPPVPLLRYRLKR